VYIQRSIGHIDVDHVRVDNETHDWLNMLENNELNVATLSMVKAAILSRCKLPNNTEMSQNELISQTHAFINNSANTVFGKRFRANIITTIFNSVYNVDANLTCTTHGVLVAHTSAIEIDDKMYPKMLHDIKAILKQMCTHGSPYHYTPLVPEVDVVPENVYDHMEDFTIEEKFAKHYQKEMDNDIDQLIKAAIVSIHHPYEESEATKQYLIDSIHHAAKNHESTRLQVPPEVQQDSDKSGVLRLTTQYEDLANALFKKKMGFRQQFIKHKKSTLVDKVAFSKNVKQFISQFGQGVTTDTSTLEGHNATDKIQIQRFLTEYGRHRSKRRSISSNAIKVRQDNILPSRNESLEEWMTTKSKSLLPFPFMVFFLPLNTLNNAVPMTIQGFNNRCLDMNIISTPKEGFHSFKETITGQKQGFFDSKLSVVFFKQVSAVSLYSELNMHIICI
jgi:hypothetical protein